MERRGCKTAHVKWKRFRKKKKKPMEFVYLFLKHPVYAARDLGAKLLMKQHTVSIRFLFYNPMNCVVIEANRRLFTVPRGHV